MRKSKKVETETITKEFNVEHLVDQSLEELVEYDMSIREVMESLALSAKAEGFFEEKYPNAHAGEVTYCNDGSKVTWDEIEFDAFGDDEDLSDSLTKVMADMDTFSNSDLIDLQLAIALELSDRITN